MIVKRVAIITYFTCSYKVNGNVYIRKTHDGFTDYNYGVIRCLDNLWIVELKHSAQAKTFKISPHLSTPDRITDRDIKRALKNAKSWIEDNANAESNDYENTKRDDDSTL